MFNKNKGIEVQSPAARERERERGEEGIVPKKKKKILIFT